MKGPSEVPAVKDSELLLHTGICFTCVTNHSDIETMSSRERPSLPPIRVLCWGHSVAVRVTQVLYRPIVQVCWRAGQKPSTSKLPFQPIHRGPFVFQTSVTDFKRPSESSRAKSADIWQAFSTFFVLHRPCAGLLQIGAPKQGLFHKAKTRSGHGTSHSLLGIASGSLFHHLLLQVCRVNAIDKRQCQGNTGRQGRATANSFVFQSRCQKMVVWVARSLQRERSNPDVGWRNRFP